MSNAESFDPIHDSENIPEPVLVEEILRDCFKLLETEGKKLVGSIKLCAEDESFRNNLGGPNIEIISCFY